MTENDRLEEALSRVEESIGPGAAVSGWPPYTRHETGHRFAGTATRR